MSEFPRGTLPVVMTYKELLPLVICVVACKSGKPKPSAEEKKAAMASIPYLGGYEVQSGTEDKVGAYTLDPNQADHGQLIAIEKWVEEAHVFYDRNGESVLRLDWPHSKNWKEDPNEKKSDQACWSPRKVGDTYWLGCRRGVFQLDKDSKVQKELFVEDIFPEDKETTFHHEMIIGESGNFLILTNEIRLVKSPKGERLRILDNSLVELDKEGKIVHAVSLFDLLGDRITTAMWEQLAEQSKAEGFVPEMNKGGDLFHTNTIAEAPNVVGPFKPGSVLLTVRNLNLLVGVDLKAGKVIWDWSKNLDYPHYAQFVDEGSKIRLLDNGMHRGTSTIVTIDIASKNISDAWAPGKDEFFTSWGGTIDMLANGNWLITECSRGRVIELDPKTKKVVWEYYAQLLTDEQQSTVARIMKDLQKEDPNPREIDEGTLLRMDIYRANLI